MLTFALSLLAPAEIFSDLIAAAPRAFFFALAARSEPPSICSPFPRATSGARTDSEKCAPPPEAVLRSPFLSFPHPFFMHHFFGDIEPFFSPPHAQRLSRAFFSSFLGISWLLLWPKPLGFPLFRDETFEDDRRPPFPFGLSACFLFRRQRLFS